ncbi:hypothetical protein AVEN_271017-1 [Araneus ventricosus]|uniref:CCHC-type domain-containing protein n=1 Tax=Araneus ventricosus TaxID=182803 RepID=A0A4Y2HG34_ARAVE|nr:hypothetical protein AVEN_271017-1 [Araneus ventricosus]
MKSTEEEILEGLSSQGGTAVKRIFMKKGTTLVATKHVILTFNTTKLSSTVKAGYIYCKTRLYIPNPIRCFKCQRFGHSKTACRGRLTCCKCASVDHLTSDCQSAELLCANCKQPHSADSKDCPQWKKEKKIQEVRTQQNLSYYEAKKLLFPEQNSMSYSNALKSSTSQPSQTDERLTKVIVPPLIKLTPVKPNVLRVKKCFYERKLQQNHLTNSAAQSKSKAFSKC